MFNNLKDIYAFTSMYKTFNPVPYGNSISLVALFFCRYAAYNTGFKNDEKLSLKHGGHDPCIMKQLQIRRRRI